MEASNRINKRHVNSAPPQLKSQPQTAFSLSFVSDFPQAMSLWHIDEFCNTVDVLVKEYNMRDEHYKLLMEAGQKLYKNSDSNMQELRQRTEEIVQQRSRQLEREHRERMQELQLKHEQLVKNLVEKAKEKFEKEKKKAKEKLEQETNNLRKKHRAALKKERDKNSESIKTEKRKHKERLDQDKIWYHAKIRELKQHHEGGGFIRELNSRNAQLVKANDELKKENERLRLAEYELSQMKDAEKQAMEYASYERYKEKMLEASQQYSAMAEERREGEQRWKERLSRLPSRKKMRVA